MNEEFFDLIIVGGGSGGLSSAIYAGRSKMKTLVIERGGYGGRINDTASVMNYPGFKEISGRDLMEKFKQHAQMYPSVKWLRSTVIDVVDEGNEKIVKTKRKGNFRAKAVILDIGTKPRILGIPGEIDFVGKGVAYCATCDAEFFKDKNVFVLGAGDQAIEEAEFLTRFAKKVTIIVLHEKGHLDCNEVAADQAFRNEKIDFIWNSTLKEIRGKEQLEKVVIENVVTKETIEYPADGVFSFVGMTPQTDIVKDLVELDPQGFVIVDEKQQTNVEGIYAIGDATTTYLRQVITASADGAKASVASERYIKERDYLEKIMSEENQKIAFVFYSPYESATIEAASDVEEKLKGKATVIRQDISKQTNLYNRLGIESVPTIALYKNREVQKILSYEEFVQSK